MRRLLPYEHALINALGITEEEYFSFRKAQQEYTDPKEGSVLDIRNGVEVAIGLAIVGVLFQVGAALLAPKPDFSVDTPDIEGNGQSQISRRVAPRSSFNTLQELAEYGQTIPIVYGDAGVNSTGGVRVNSLLVRSAIFSFARTQFAQLMAVISSGDVKAIEPDSASLGQTLASQLPFNTTWLYFAKNRIPRYTDKISANSSIDPSQGPDSRFADVYGGKAILANSQSKGFSQAFSPPSGRLFGLIDPIPLKDDVVVRLSNGEEEPFTIRNFGSRKGGQRIFDIIFNQVELDQGTEEKRRGSELLDQIVQSLEIGSLYKFRELRCRLTRLISEAPNGAVDLTQGRLTARFEALPFSRSFDGSNDYNLKKIAKIREATYVTSSEVDAVNFTFKARVFQNIQGRQKFYGRRDNDGNPVPTDGFDEAQNGVKYRQAFFLVKYRKFGEQTWILEPGIFVVRRASEAETFFSLVFKAPSRDRWEFIFEPVIDAGQEIRAQRAINFSSILYHYIDGTDTFERTTLTGLGSNFRFPGRNREPILESGDPPIDKAPVKLSELDIYGLRADTVFRTSFDNGPEFEIISITENQQQTTDYSVNLYDNMSIIGLNAFSGPELNNLRSLSVFVSQGKKVRTLNNGSFSSVAVNSSSIAPEIFLDTLLDQRNGIGQYINTEGIDLVRLFQAKQFCLANSYHMDGVIAGEQSWRQFWTQVAPYSLLELAKIGGRETLIPSVPVDGNNRKTRAIQISALFNQGNILEGTYKEDFIDYGDSTQDLIATVIFRNQDRLPGNKINLFPRNESVTVSRKNIDNFFAVRRTFDLSDFVTRREQAIDYAKLLCNQQRFVRRAVEFQTFPTEAPIEPGSYVFVQVDENKWDDIQSGQVLKDGSINIPLTNTPLNGTFSTLIYVPGEQPQVFSVNYTNGQSSFFNQYKDTGALFVVGLNVREKRVFRVVAVAIGEEGEVTISAVEHPCIQEQGEVRSLVADFRDNNFDIR